MPRPVQSLHKQSSIMYQQHGLWLDIHDAKLEAIQQLLTIANEAHVTSVMASAVQMEELQNQYQFPLILVLDEPAVAESSRALALLNTERLAAVAVAVKVGNKQDPIDWNQLALFVKKAKSQRLHPILQIDFAPDCSDVLRAYSVFMAMQIKAEFVSLNLPVDAQLDSILQAADGGRILVKLDFDIPEQEVMRIRRYLAAGGLGVVVSCQLLPHGSERRQLQIIGEAVFGPGSFVRAKV